jgi:hypothetical protein
MTFDQILILCQKAGYTLTGSSRKGYTVDGLQDRFGRTYSATIPNSATLWCWARETFGGG